MGLISYCLAEVKSPSVVIKQEIEELRSIPADFPTHKSAYKKLLKKKPSIPEKMKQKISLSISETLPLKQALLTLSEQAKIDLQLDASIQQSVVFSAHNRPLIDVIHDLCELAGLRYHLVQGGFVLNKMPLILLITMCIF